jgi:hypothetical protein
MKQGDKVFVVATIDKIVHRQDFGRDMILLENVYVNGEFFRDHSWIKMIKRFAFFKSGDTFTANATVYEYIDPDNIEQKKIGIKSLRRVYEISEPGALSTRVYFNQDS